VSRRRTLTEVKVREEKFGPDGIVQTGMLGKQERSALSSKISREYVGQELATPAWAWSFRPLTLLAMFKKCTALSRCNSKIVAI
jgi:hypothetical protein